MTPRGRFPVPGRISIVQSRSMYSPMISGNARLGAAAQATGAKVGTSASSAAGAAGALLGWPGGRTFVTSS